MREFKFRAWVKKNDEMFHDVDPTHYRHDDESYALMQYTGLKDINGKEIYEGDIVKSHSFAFDGNFDGDLYRQGEIGFSHDCCFVIKVDDSQFGFFETSHFEDPCIEVIGNRYENPELLEASQ